MSSASRRTPRVLAFGLEAAEPSLIERFCAEGELPTLTGLMRKGGYRKLLSTTDISSGSTWASVNTGVGPGKHGIGFYHRQLETGTYHIVKKYAEDVKRPPFWLDLAVGGERVAVIDVPETHVVPDMNGIQIVGWGAEALNAPAGSWPPELFREIRARFGVHPLTGWYQARPATIEGWTEFLEKILWSVRTRGAIAQDLLAREPWGLFLLAFPESHWAGHFFWHLMDEGHPDHDRELAAVCGDAIRLIYREIDAALGKLIEGASDASILVFSNTGMGPNYSGQHLLPEVLERLGLAGTQEASDGEARGARWKWGPYAVKSVERLVTPKGIEWARKLLPERLWDTWTRRLLTLGSSWDKSRAFVVPGDYTGAIRINLRGREPAGRVADGPEYDALCAELCAELSLLENPATGERAVSAVLKVREAFPGENVDDLPDLIVKWVGQDPLTALASPRIGTVRGRLPDERSGAHMPFGFLIGAGPEFSEECDLEPASIMDIGPTILHLLGAAVPDDMDGRVLVEMLEDCGGSR